MVYMPSSNLGGLGSWEFESLRSYQERKPVDTRQSTGTWSEGFILKRVEDCLHRGDGPYWDGHGEFTYFPKVYATEKLARVALGKPMNQWLKRYAVITPVRISVTEFPNQE